MNYRFETSSYFEKEAKRLAKHYPSFAKDLAIFADSLQKDPYQGVDLGGGIRKIRMQISLKGKGKVGEARVITMNLIIDEANLLIRLLLIYDKKDADNYNEQALKEAIKEFV